MQLVAHAFAAGADLQHCVALSQEVLQLLEQHAKAITPYVNTAKNPNFHTKFNLSFKSTF